MNIYMNCTLWTSFPAKRDWTNSYRGKVLYPFYSNLCSVERTCLRFEELSSDYIQLNLFSLNTPSPHTLFLSSSFQCLNISGNYTHSVQPHFIPGFLFFRIIFKRIKNSFAKLWNVCIFRFRSQHSQEICLHEIKTFWTKLCLYFSPHRKNNKTKVFIERKYRVSWLFKFQVCDIQEIWQKCSFEYQKVYLSEAFTGF